MGNYTSSFLSHSKLTKNSTWQPGGMLCGVRMAWEMNEGRGYLYWKNATNSLKSNRRLQNLNERLVLFV
jgi:ABC-type multidrug transport system permease subunit